MKNNKLKMPTREQFKKMTDEEKKDLWMKAKQQNEERKANKKTDKKKPKFEFKKNKKTLVIAIVIAVTLVFGAVFVCTFGIFGTINSHSVIKNSPEKVEKVEKGQEDHVNFMINPAIIVEGKKMTYIDFHNLNKGKEMKVQIKFKGEKNYVYKSPTIKEGKALMEANLKKKPPKEQTPAIAEMSAYDKKGNEVDSSTCEIILIQRGE